MPNGEMKEIKDWFEKETSNPTIEPVDSFKITSEGPVRLTGSGNGQSAENTFNQLLWFDRIYLWFKSKT